MNRPWCEIVAQYAEDADRGLAMRAMHSLTQHIAEGPLSIGLYAWTSMFDLCIVQTEVTYPYDGPYLKVSPLPDGRIEFRYLDTPEKKSQWSRIVNPDEAVPRLLKFLDQLHWFPAEMLHP